MIESASVIQIELISANSHEWGERWKELLSLLLVFVPRLMCRSVFLVRYARLQIAVNKMMWTSLDRNRRWDCNFPSADAIQLTCQHAITRIRVDIMQLAARPIVLSFLPCCSLSRDLKIISTTRFHSKRMNHSITINSFSAVVSCGDACLFVFNTPHSPRCIRILCHYRWWCSLL